MKQLDRSTIRAKLDRFVVRWRKIIDSLDETERKHSESSEAQRFWDALLLQFGITSERVDLFEERHGASDPTSCVTTDAHTLPIDT